MVPARGILADAQAKRQEINRAVPSIYNISPNTTPTRRPNIAASLTPSTIAVNITKPFNMSRPQSQAATDAANNAAISSWARMTASMEERSHHQGQQHPMTFSENGGEMDRPSPLGGSPRKSTPAPIKSAMRKSIPDPSSPTSSHLAAAAAAASAAAAAAQAVETSHRRGDEVGWTQAQQGGNATNTTGNSNITTKPKINLRSPPQSPVYKIDEEEAFQERQRAYAHSYLKERSAAFNKAREKKYAKELAEQLEARRQLQIEHQKRMKEFEMHMKQKSDPPMKLTLKPGKKAGSKKETEKELTVATASASGVGLEGGPVGGSGAGLVANTQKGIRLVDVSVQESRTAGQPRYDRSFEREMYVEGVSKMLQAMPDVLTADEIPKIEAFIPKQIAAKLLEQGREEVREELRLRSEPGGRKEKEASLVYSLVYNYVIIWASLLHWFVPLIVRFVAYWLPVDSITKDLRNGYRPTEGLRHQRGVVGQGMKVLRELPNDMLLCKIDNEKDDLAEQLQADPNIREGDVLVKRKQQERIHNVTEDRIAEDRWRERPEGRWTSERVADSGIGDVLFLRGGVLGEPARWLAVYLLGGIGKGLVDGIGDGFAMMSKKAEGMTTVPS